MLKILIIILLVVLVPLLYLLYMYPDYMKEDMYQLIFVMGPKGSGKTTYIVADALKWLKKGYKVYTNKSLPFCYFYSPKDLETQRPDENSVVYWDEVSLDHDNRNFKDFSTDLTEMLRLQRHFKFRLVVLSQTYDADKKIRDQSQKILILKKVLCWTLIKPVKKNITVQNNTQTGKGDIVESYEFRSLLSWRFIFLPRYRFFYDSFEVTSFKQRDYLKATLTQFNDMQLDMIRNKKYRKNEFKRIFRFINKLFRREIISYYE